ncbi:MAG: hypothetical protein H6R24_974 [Proteobacteria bacterium]|nr:hypothetical protein [Pseudomonadota bacterium]
MAQGALVVVHVADGFDAPAEIAAFHRRSPHAQIIDHFRCDADARAGVGLPVVGIDRNVVHAHLILGRGIGKDGRIHRMPVFDRLAFAWCSGGGNGWFGRLMTQRGEPGLQAGRQQHASAEQQNGDEGRQEGFHGIRVP